MSFFDLFKKEKVTFEDVLDGFETCIGRSFDDEVQADRKKVRNLFYRSKVCEEDIVNALVEKYYVPELTKVPAPVELTHGNETYRVTATLEQCDKEKAQEYATEFVKSLLDKKVEKDAFCSDSLDYGLCGRTLFGMTICRCSDGKEWSMRDATCETVRDDETFAKVVRIFCEVGNRLIEEERDLYCIFQELDAALSLEGIASEYYMG